MDISLHLGSSSVVLGRFVSINQSINQLLKCEYIYTHTLPVEACTLHEVVGGFFLGGGGGRRRAMCDVCLTLGVCILRTSVSFISGKS